MRSSGSKRPWPWLLLLAGFCCLVAASPASPAASAPAVDFDRDIRPILSDNCFACHGPDEAKRKAGFRLDKREDALKPAKSGERPIVPGNAGQSELIARITAKDEDDRMPPVATGKKLTDHQIGLLRRWIESGAEWKGHWAFAAPVRSDPPAVRDPAWPRNDIDRFVLARLEREELKPAPEADRATLVRRASLDITGLPPTVEEVDAFLGDGSPGAYEKLVDRLLASPRYGEHMARYWLDAVRYADTHGYHIDSRRDMWKYRDWVIDAFNTNKRFDQFTIEQLAGDLLPNATIEQKIGTGYVRANMTTGEGGVIEDEYRAKYTFDRVETTGAIYLGMTLVCARCHSHKYDPIEQREYYSLYAFFNQVADPVMDGNKPNPEPFLPVPSPAQSSRLAWLKEHSQRARADLDAPRAKLDAEQKNWQRDWHLSLLQGWSDLEPEQARSLSTNGAALRIGMDRSILAEGRAAEGEVFEVLYPLEPGPLSALRLELLPRVGSTNSGSGTQSGLRIAEIEAELVSRANGEEGKPRRLAFSLAESDVELASHGVRLAIDGNAETFWQLPAVSESHLGIFLLKEPVQIGAKTALKIRLRQPPGETAPPSHFRMGAAQTRELARVLHPQRFSSWHVVGPLKAKDPDHGLDEVFEPERKVDLKMKFPGVREEVAWTERGDWEDGRAALLVPDLHGVHGVRYLYRTLTLAKGRPVELDVRADGAFKLWINGALAAQRESEASAEEGPVSVTAQLLEGQNEFLLKIVTVQGASSFTFAPDLGSEEGLTSEIAAALCASASDEAPRAAQVKRYFRRQHSREYRKTDNDFVHWQEEKDAIERAIPTTLVAKEDEKPRDTFMLLRGDYDKKGEKVTPQVPAIFPPLPPGAPANRLGLAMWLVDKKHPLTARVAVNRLWQQYFGVGIVKTAEDFGVQGERPSDQELLDWLATEFQQSGWDIKHLNRLILTSATYRQSSRTTREQIARDPENRLLARGPRFRMDAEAVRDTALCLSGLLLENERGPSVRPYEPPGLWEAVSFNSSQKYVQDTGPGQYRRSLYTFWKRQSPPPSMLIFDAPSREACTIRRSRSNTPLQALVLLNDPQFVEASRAFGQRIMLGGNTVESRIDYAFRLATARRPDSGEMAVLRRVYQEQLREFQKNDRAVELLLAVGSFKQMAQLDRAELAAWSLIASLLLNLDETITKS